MSLRATGISVAAFVVASFLLAQPGVASSIAQIIDTIKNVVNPPPTSEQKLLNYAKKASREAGSLSYYEAEVINDMKLIGMQEMRAVTAFTAKKAVLKEKMQKELVAKRVPADVVEAIAAGVTSVSKYMNSLEDFTVDSSGTGKIFKATVMITPDRSDEESSQVAMAVSGAEFSAASTVDHYLEETVPVYQEIEEIETVIESGILGDYKVPKKVTKIQNLGTRTKKTPIFKEKSFTKAKLEAIKNFLEGKTLGEVKLLYGEDQHRNEV